MTGHLLRRDHSNQQPHELQPLSKQQRLHQRGVLRANHLRPLKQRAELQQLPALFDRGSILSKVYQQCTQEGWTDIMIDLQIRYGEFIWLWVFAYIVIGTYIIINLVLAVVTIRFVQAQEKVL